MTPVYSSDASELLEQFKKANEEEGVVIKTLSAYMQSPTKEMKKVMSLSKEFEEAHNKTMKIYSELQKFRLDIDPA